MPIEYSINKGLQDALSSMLCDMSLAEFTPLRDSGIKVLACTKVKFQDEEEQPCSGDPVSVRKVSDLHRVFIDGHYLLVADQYTFSHSNELQLKALLHSALMRISVENTESGLKLGIRKPDIMAFQATINRFGAYTDALLGLRDCLVTASKRFANMVTTESTERSETLSEPVRQAEEVPLPAQKRVRFKKGE
jgi:hypothetical protein